jgi:acyl-CoA synthetase (AMP-forming)/AMP-acid ligase II
MGVHSPNIIANALISLAKYYPQGEYIIYGDRRITWGEFVPRVFRIASALRGLGIKKDDKVAFMFHNTPEFIEINAGIQTAGAIPVPMNYRFIPAEIEYQVQHSDAKVLFYEALWAENVEPALANIPNIEHAICKGKSSLKQALDYESFVRSGSDTDPAVPTGLDDVAVMIYTGGTTGFPKGVMLTYGAHVDMFAKMNAAILISILTGNTPLEKQKRMIPFFGLPGEVIIVLLLGSKTFKKILARPGIYEFLRKTLYQVFTDPDKARKKYGKGIIKSMTPSQPYFHDASYQGLLSGLLSGNACYVMTEGPSFDPAAVLGMIEREKVALMGNVPTGWKKLTDYFDFEKYDVSSLVLATTGGAACPKELKKQILKKFPKALLLDAFGQTEMTPVTTLRVDGDPEGIAARSVGKAIVETKIVDETGNDVPNGEVGEICYRSNTMMKGYYKDEAKTKEVMQDGWFRSGDLGYLDEYGEIRTVDRKKECINTGGEKVFPLEVEELIQTHPKVDMAVVIGVPNEEWGSTVRAVVKLNDGQQMAEKEAIDFCRGKMAGYKIPRSVVFVDEIPISPVGKVLRQQIRDLYGQPA